MMQADLVAPREDLDFYDTRGIDLPHAITALEGWTLAMRRPLPGMALAFRIRDAISARFGVKRIGGFSGRQDQAPKPGDMLDFFVVERIEPEILTLSERARHLDLVTCITTYNQRLTITASVKVHNSFGRLYMIPVAPAHRLIVTMMMRGVRRELEGN